MTIEGGSSGFSIEKGLGNLSFRYVKRLKELRDAFYGREEMLRKRSAFVIIIFQSQCIYRS